MRAPLIAAVFAAAALAQPQAPDSDAVLEHARTWALHYSRTLPDFFCTEFIRRFWQDAEVRIDTLSIELGFSQQKPTYRLVARNNRPSRQSIQSLNGAFSRGEFGSALALIFNPESSATFQPEAGQRIRRRRVAVYSFAVPQSTSRYRLQYGVSEAIVAYHGRVYVDPQSSRVLRITMDIDPPDDFPIQKTSTVIDYDWRDIGGTQYLLPVHADVRTVERVREPAVDLQGRRITQLSKHPVRYHNIVEFRDYHKYAIESKIGFDP